MSDFTEEHNPGMHRYSNPHGRDDLLEAIVQTKSQHLAQSTKEEVLLPQGPPVALVQFWAQLYPRVKSNDFGPFWPLIAGIVRSFKGEPGHPATVRARDHGSTTRRSGGTIFRGGGRYISQYTQQSHGP